MPCIALQGSKTGVEYQPPVEEEPSAAEQATGAAADVGAQVQSVTAPVDEATASAAMEETAAELTAEFVANPGAELRH